MSKRLDLDDLLGTAPRRSKAEQLAEFKVTLGKVEKEEEEKIIEGSARKRPRSEGTEKWWEIPERTLTPELKRDLQIIQSRGYIDPKRFYKTDKEQKKLPTRFQIGTIVESAFDGPSGRLTNKERKPTIAMELLADESFKAYGQKHVDAISDAKAAGSKKAYKKMGKARRRKGRR